jgi:hypothetical protein
MGTAWFGKKLVWFPDVGEAIWIKKGAELERCEDGVLWNAPKGFETFCYNYRMDDHQRDFSDVYFLTKKGVMIRVLLGSVEEPPTDLEKLSRVKTNRRRR